MVQMIVVIIGAIFGGLAALMAYLIAYEEYLHHFPDRKTTRRMAIESALVAFVFFFGMGLLLAAVLPRFL